jgi:VanZ family protein/O-antigen ligase
VASLIGSRASNPRVERAVRQLLIWGPVAAWAVVIFTLSSIPGDDVGDGSPRLLPKLAHLLEYGILGVLLARAQSASVMPRSLTWPLALAGLYAISDELHQSFVPGRTPLAADVLIDVAGAALGLLAWRWRSSHRLPDVGFLVLGLSLAVATAVLVTGGMAEVALGAVLAAPALAVLYRYPFVAVFVWLAVEPFLLSTDTTDSRTAYWAIHRALPVVAIVALLARNLVRANERRLPRLAVAELAMAGYLVVSAISIYLWSGAVQGNLFFLYDRVFVPMCLYMLVRLSAPDKTDLSRLVPLILFVCVSQWFIGVLSWVAPGVLPQSWLGLAGARTTGSLIAYSVYGTTMIFVGLFLLHSGLNSRSNWSRVLQLAGFVLAGSAVFLTFSRGSWLAGLLVVGGIVCIYPRHALRLAAFVLPVALVLGLTVMSDQVRWASDRLGSTEAQESALSRLPVVYGSLQMLQEEPLLGWGYGNFDELNRRFQGRVGEVNADKDTPSHNLYLTLLAEQGALGFTLYVLPAVWWLYVTVRNYRYLPPAGFDSRRLLVMLWLVIGSHIVVNNFSNMRVVFGLGMWWFTLGLIASFLDRHVPRAAPAAAGRSPVRARRLASPTVSAGVARR